MTVESPNANNFEDVKGQRVHAAEKVKPLTEEEKNNAEDAEFRIEEEKKDGRWGKFFASIKNTQGKIKDFFDESGLGIGAKEAWKELGRDFLAFGKNAKEKIKNFNFNPEEALAKLEKKKIFGSKIGTFLGGMAAGSAVRWIANSAFGYGILAGASAGAIWEGSKIYVRESRKIREFAENQNELQKIVDGLGAENASTKEKLEKYLELGRMEKILPEMGKEKEDLFKSLRKELKLDSNKWKKVAKGALKGAVVGAAGAYVAGIVGDYFSHSDVSAGPKEAIAGGIGENISEDTKGIAYSSYGETVEGVKSAGAAGLDGETFTAVADKGDGFTHISRKLIHDYISQKQELGIDLNLDKSQLIYAEDSLKNLFGGQVIRPGDPFQLTGGEISSAIDKAKLLTDAGKEHIKNEYVSKIGERVWEEVTNYDLKYNSANDFSGAILKEAEEKGLAAAKEAVKSIPPEIAYASAGEKKAVEAAAESWLSQNWKQYLVYGAGIGAAGVYAYKEETKEIYNGAKEKVKSFRKTEEKKKPEPEIIDLKESDIESDEPYFDEPMKTVRESDEYLDNVKEDPLYEYLEGKNIDLKTERDGKIHKLMPGDIEYYVLDHSSGNYMRKGNYGEVVEWYGTLPEEERKWVINKNKDAKNKPIYLSIPQPLQNYLKNHAEIRKGFFNQMKKMNRELFSDFKKAASSRPFHPDEETRSPDMGNEGKDLKVENRIEDEDGARALRRGMGDAFGSQYGLGDSGATIDEQFKKPPPYEGDEGLRNPEMGNDYNSKTVNIENNKINKDIEMKDMERTIRGVADAINIGTKNEYSPPLTASFGEIATKKREQIKIKKSKTVKIPINSDEEKIPEKSSEELLKDLEEKRVKEISEQKARYESMSDLDLSTEEQRLRGERDGLISDIRDAIPADKNVKAGQKDERTIRIDGMLEAYNPRLGMIRDIINERRNAKKPK
ncbi:hypothetical protein HYT00_00745 [Candidatus Giovannonibacteria bacterium]|nr:hypothetical protein [Candidatus Giovannonibacteria bacterium]